MGRLRQPTVSWAAVVLLAGSVSATRAAADMSGWWRLTGTRYGTAIVSVNQNGALIEFDYAGFAFQSSPADPPSDVQWGAYAADDSTQCGGLSLLATMPHPDFFKGVLFDIGLSCFGGDHGELSGERCSCYDGNTEDGDGCSAACQVETCFNCTGDPSQCTPTADTGACDDGGDCTVGEQCLGGVCGGGTLVSPCVDLTGSWRTSLRNLAPQSQTVSLRVIQRHGLLRMFSSTGNLVWSGSVDLASGAFDLYTAPTHPTDIVRSEWCISRVDGTADPDSRGFRGDTVLVTAVTSMRCITDGVVFAGQRCSNQDCSVCVGDCNDDAQVEIGELVTSVNIALGRTPLDQCFFVDANDNGAADVSELTGAVNRLLNGCP